MLLSTVKGRVQLVRGLCATFYSKRQGTVSTGTVLLSTVKGRVQLVRGLCYFLQ